MDAPDARLWFLRKHADAIVFGPLRFDQLAHWATFAQIAPNDSISTEQENWMKAPMLPELAMDWIVEVTSERLYGPTTLGAVREFMRMGEINEDTFVINSCDGTRRQVRDIMPLFASLPLEEGTELPQESMATTAPAAAGMSIAAEERIRDLERALREGRRAFHELEERYRELEAKYQELANAAAPRS